MMPPVLFSAGRTGGRLVGGGGVYKDWKSVVNSNEKYKKTKKDMIEPVRSFLRKESDVSEFMHNRDVVMWVDWGDFDDAIIRYCERILQTGKLSAEYKDADYERGFGLWIHYDGKAMKVPYEGEAADRDTTLISLNEILNPDYEIRLWRGSFGSDTLAFVPMKTEEWEKLEAEFGTDKIEKEFMRIEKGTAMFEMDMDEAFRLAEEYEAYENS